MADADPATVVIFGGAGDLTRRKLLPALYNLHVDGLLPPRVVVVGVARKSFDDEAYRGFAREAIVEFSRRPMDETAWQQFAASLFFVNASVEEPDTLDALRTRLDGIERERGMPGNRIHYLALPPSLFEATVEGMARARLTTGGGDGPWSRIVVEKPIGHDLQSACAINDAIARVFAERQIYRIDHYLGKETVQNILVMRFANSIFEPLFNQKYIDHVQVTVAESEGVGTRAGYYDRAGALRDMVQNHMLQLLALTATEPPHSLDADVVRDEKLGIIQSLRPVDREGVDALAVRAQYGPGADSGAPVAGYLDEPGVGQRSRTETFVALRLEIDNWRWFGVPFFLRTGKRLPKRASEISIQMKEVPPILFNADRSAPLEPNVLTIRIVPDEGFSLGISSKIPGHDVHVYPVKMDFQYGSAFGGTSPEAYEHLLRDVMIGDPSLFMRRDTVEAAWRWITPILERWAEDETSVLPTYPAGTWGPPEADRLIESAGRRWRAL